MGINPSFFHTFIQNRKTNIICTTYFLQNYFLTFEMLDRIFTDQCKGICHRQSDKFTGLPNVEPFATISGVAHCTKMGNIIQSYLFENMFFNFQASFGWCVAWHHKENFNLNMI